MGLAHTNTAVPCERLHCSLDSLIHVCVQLTTPKVRVTDSRDKKPD